MVDLNFLKHINDTYGHKHGDAYIVAASVLLCDTFKNPRYTASAATSLWRYWRAATTKTGRRCGRFWPNALPPVRSTAREPWERCSAAIGMAVYHSGDSGPEDVFVCADAEMYRNKKEMKACRK